MRKMDAYWRAVNYLSVWQITLYDDPLLKNPWIIRTTFTSMAKTCRKSETGSGEQPSNLSSRKVLNNIGDIAS
jgi:hypothetical protein